jgi:hypothetical protein
VFHQASLSLLDRGGRPPRAAAAESLRIGLLRFAAFELAVWASLYAAYLAVRGATIGSPDEALQNGREIAAAESALRIFHEATVQDALSTLESFFSAYYMVGFAPLIAGTLVWLALRHRQHYGELRTALLVSISIATVVFVVFPAAPPRLIPDLGIADTVGLSSHDTGSFAGVRFNPYAAMPSMHVGWSLLSRARRLPRRQAADPAAPVRSTSRRDGRRRDGHRKPLRARRRRRCRDRHDGGRRMHLAGARLAPSPRPRLEIRAAMLRVLAGATTIASRGRRQQT